MKTGEVSISNPREVTQLYVKMNKVGRPTYLIPGEESLVVAEEEIEGNHGLPVNTATISTELQYVVASVKAIETCKNITHNTA